MSIPEPDARFEQTEELVVGGEAVNVLGANQEAWASLEAVLGGDPVAAWTLAEMRHSFARNEDGQPLVVWQANFKRNMEVESPPIIQASAEGLALPTTDEEA